MLPHVTKRWRITNSLNLSEDRTRSGKYHYWILICYVLVMDCVGLMDS